MKAASRPPGPGAHWAEAQLPGCCWQSEAGGGDSCTWGGKFRLVVGARGGAPQRGRLWSAGLGMGRAEIEGGSGSGSLPPHTCSLDLGLPGMEVLASLSEAPPLSKLTRLVSWQRRPHSGLKSSCSPSDKGFLAYLLMALHNTPLVPVHPLLSDDTFMECPSPNECVARNGGEALLGELGDIWDSLHMLHKAAFFVFGLGGVLP